jgi:hypothetical protein
LIDEILQGLSDGMIPIRTFLVELEPPVQGGQAKRVDINDIINTQKVVPKQTFELERDLPIGLAEEFRQAVELRLRKEVAGLDFDIHGYGTWEVSQLTEVPDLVTSFVFVEVENDLMGVWRDSSVSRV